MERRIAYICLAVLAMLSTSVISKADIVLKDEIQNATVTFYALENDSKGDVITTVASGTEFILADIQPTEGYWTNISLLNAPESLADIGSANVRTRSTEIQFGAIGTIEKFGKLSPNGGGLYKLGIQANDGITYITLSGLMIENISLDATKVNIGGKEFELSIESNVEEYTYNGTSQSPIITKASIQDDDGIVFDFDVADNLELLIKKGDDVVTESTSSGEYQLIVSAKSDGCFKNKLAINYEIKGAPLTITADDKTKTYGDPNPEEWTFSYTGFLNEDTEDVVTVKPTVTTEATATSNVGTYPITPANATAANYEITYTAGTLTIVKATLTATAKDASVKQGEATPELEVIYSGFKNDDTESSLTEAPKATTTREVSSEPGEYEITVSGGLADNYEFTYKSGVLTVIPAGSLAVIAKSYTITYGDAIPTFEYTAGDATLSGTPTIKCEATTASPAGTYDIIIEKGDVTDENVTFVNGTLTIEKAPLTISADDKSKAYGDANPELTVSYSGFVNDETSDALTTLPSISTTATAESSVGTYDITASGAAADNYEISYVAGKLTISASTSEDEDGNSIEEDGINVTLKSASDNDIDEDGNLLLPDDISNIDDQAFESLDKTAIKAVDLTNTSLTGINVSRESGVFKDFPENVLIYLPSGNTVDADEPNVVIGGLCQKLILSDDAPVELPNDFSASEVVYPRQLSVEKAATIYLPYSLSSDETISYYELYSSNENSLVFNEVSTTTAYQPYLAIPKTDEASLGKSVSTSIKKHIDEEGEKSVTGYKMIGTETGISRTEAEGKYILQDDNMWHQVTPSSPATVNIPAYHAYIEATTTSSARLQIILNGTEGTTSIISIEADKIGKWYDLNGRRLQTNPTVKGVYIVNGKKVVK